MSTVLNINTLELRTSVHTPDYAPQWESEQGRSLHGDWLVQPDLSAVEAVPSRYWKLDLQSLAVVEMKQDEKDVVDFAEAAAQKVALVEAKLGAVDFDALALASGAKDSAQLKAEYRAALESKVVSTVVGLEAR